MLLGAAAELLHAVIYLCSGTGKDKSRAFSMKVI